ncbi:hypothetical protein JHL17_06715 [Azospirillum sp. YIM B02556]|uniref:Uncharacterized protein n=1 Tax=Azospirillum endophyticum TaxID=2800326 RepID=A0ABS1F0Z9_9PROT|nr:hypothetical protein [Azospirillum endophyticum]MBK1837099.1 hypothetical protein [Azospirillum endophyticum]
MNVAAATSTVSRPFAFMTPRGSDAVETGAGTRTPTPSTPEGATGTDAAAGANEPLVNRFPSIAFSYDTDASRLVMLYRDPASGKTVSQIPTESALKQYKENQQKEKDAERASLLKLTVGGSGPGSTQSAAHGRAGTDPSLASGGGAVGRGTWAIDSSGGASRPAAPAALAASVVAASVAQSSSAIAPSAARVNMVI